MSKILTPNFRTNMAQQFKESLSEAANTIYYVATHRSVSYPDDSNPPTIGGSVHEAHYELFDQMLFGKHVLPSDVAYMTRYIPWENGTVYDMYDDKDPDLATKDFFVVSEESDSYHVFKCLNNNNGAPSTDQPLLSETSAHDSIYILTDGYQWKYMYSITETEWRKFSTANYIPVFPNANVSANAISGAIEHIMLKDGGSQNNNYANGTFLEVSVASNNLIHSIQSDTSTLSSNTDFYKNASLYVAAGPGEGQLRNIVEYIVTGSEKRVLLDREFDTLPGLNSVFEISPRVIISGDGANASARCEVNPNGNTISDIIMIERGADYTYADVQIVANTGLIGQETTTEAESVVMISPPGGHGSDAIRELHATRVGISVEYNGDELGTIPATNDYRVVSLIKDPLFAQAVLSCNTVSHSAPSAFTAGETVIQQTTGASATIADRDAFDLELTNIRGFFETSQGAANTATHLVVGQTSGAEAYVTAIDRGFETFNQSQVFNVEITYTGPGGTGFELDEQVVQAGIDDLASNIIILSTDIDATEFTSGEVINQPDTGASGTVSNRVDNYLTLVNVSGGFATGNTSVNEITGVTSGKTAAVSAIDNTVMATAVGNIYSLNKTPTNSDVIGLSDVRGNFALSDDETNTINTFRGQKSQSEAKLIGRSFSHNHLVDGVGQFLYLENFQPIQRSDEQTEKIKLIIEF